MQTIVHTVEGTCRSQEAEDTGSLLDTSLTVEDSDGVEQEEEPKEGHQAEERKSRFDGSSPHEECEDNPSRKEHTVGIVEVSSSLVSRVNTEQIRKNSTNGHEEGTVAKQEGGTPQVVVNDSPDTSDDLNQTRREEQSTNQDSWRSSVSGTAKNQTKNKEGNGNQSATCSTGSWEWSIFTRSLVPVNSQ